MDALLFSPRADARYIRFTVRWAEPNPEPQEEKRRAPSSPPPAISAIEVAVVSDRPLPTKTLPLELPKFQDLWF